MSSDQPLSHVAEQVRRFDRERFVAALFAPPEARERLMVLYAFNIELAKVRDSVREPMAGMVRLQWWREVVEGKRDDEAARNPVAGPLRRMVVEQALPPELFETMLTAREADLSAQPPADLDELEGYAAGTAGALSQLAARALGAADGETLAAARAIGTAYGLAGLLRSVPVHLAGGWLTLPRACLRQAGTSADEVLAGRAPRRTIAEAVRPVAARACALVAEGRSRRADRRAVPALLPAVQAMAHVAALRRMDWDVFDGRLARPRAKPLRLAVKALLGRF